MRHSLLHPDERHPLILPQKSNLTKLLVLDAHSKTLHGGTQLILNYLRQRFWILCGRQVVKSAIFNCIRCWRQRAQPATQLMGDLPFKRVQPFRPFLHSGVDYAGPIHLRFSKGRGTKSYKGYICVFVCFSTRAVHLEAVSSYSTPDCLSAYKRFTARRGICAPLTKNLNFCLIKLALNKPKSHVFWLLMGLRGDSIRLVLRTLEAFGRQLSNQSNSI